MQATQVHPKPRIENRNRTQQQERRCASQTFHVEAFNKVCRVLNIVHQVRRTNWDLRVLAVHWTCRAMCKNLSAEMIPKLRSRIETIFLEERNPHAIAPTVGTVREDQDKGIMQLREGEHMQIQEAIRRGNLKLHELEEDRVQLRKKRMLMDVEIKKLENEIVQACLIDKLRMKRQDTDSHTTAVKDCR